MRRIAATIGLVLALTTASISIGSSEAEANPMILGIAAWKFVTIVAVSLVIGGAIGAHASAHNHLWASDGNMNGCPVHISAKDGHRYVRANCT